MTQKVKYFQKILKYKYPTLYNEIRISINSKSNYTQYMGIYGRIRAELNYNSKPKYEIVITFPNKYGLYNDMGFFIKFVWDIDDILATFDFDGTNHFQFTE